MELGIQRAEQSVRGRLVSALSGIGEFKNCRLQNEPPFESPFKSLVFYIDSQVNKPFSQSLAVLELGLAAQTSRTESRKRIRGTPFHLQTSNESCFESKSDRSPSPFQPKPGRKLSEWPESKSESEMPHRDRGPGPNGNVATQKEHSRLPRLQSVQCRTQATIP